MPLFELSNGLTLITYNNNSKDKRFYVRKTTGDDGPEAIPDALIADKLNKFVQGGVVITKCEGAVRESATATSLNCAKEIAASLGNEPDIVRFDEENLRFVTDLAIKAESVNQSGIVTAGGRISGNFAWFSQDGSVPESAFENMENFPLSEDRTLWTDLTKLTPENKERLESIGVAARDYRELAPHNLSEQIERFVSLGHAGDKCAYAVASDLLRMAAFEEFVNCKGEKGKVEKTYVFTDCNDVRVTQPEQDFRICLEVMLPENRTGFFFPVNKIEEGLFEFRNDVMVCYVTNETKDCLLGLCQTYDNCVLSEADSYKKPSSPKEAYETCNRISVFYTHLARIVMMPSDGSYGVRFVTMLSTIFNPDACDVALLTMHERQLENSSTWVGYADQKEARNLDGERIEEANAEVRRQKLTSDGAAGSVANPNSSPESHVQTQDTSPNTNPDLLKAGNRTKEDWNKILTKQETDLSHSGNKIMPPIDWLSRARKKRGDVSKRGNEGCDR